MSALWLTLLLAAVPPQDVGARIHAADQAARTLQGPLDGAWTLYDASGKALYALQFTDPVGGASPLQGAWRDLNGQRPHEDVGLFASLRRHDGVFTLTIPAHDGQAMVSVRLWRGGHGMWRGRMVGGDEARAIVLKRD